LGCQGCGHAHLDGHDLARHLQQDDECRALHLVTLGAHRCARCGKSYEARVRKLPTILGETFYSLSLFLQMYLERHRKSLHLKKFRKELKCPECNKLFYHPQLLKVHIARKHKNKLRKLSDRYKIPKLVR